MSSLRAPSSAPHSAPHYTYEEYLRALEVSRLRLDYQGGVIYALAGGSLTHAELTGRVVRGLGNALGTGGHVFTSDLKVRVEATDFCTFPDVSVVVGEAKTHRADPSALVNPSLLVEVTSRATEQYDRTEKLRHYKQLPSVRAVLFVSHQRERITLMTRPVEAPPGGSSDEWPHSDFGPGAILEFDALGLRLDVSELYRGVMLEVAL